MENRSFKFFVGLFFLLFLTGGFAFILWFSQTDFKEEENIYVIRVQGSVNGLRVNETVRFNGIPIGLVKRIFVDQKDMNTVKVKVSINKPELIREDSVASIEAQGLTGFTYINITGGSSDSPILKAEPGKKHPTILSNPSKMETFFSAGPQIMERVQSLTERLNILFNEENTQQLSLLFRNLSALSTEMIEVSKTFEATLTKFDQHLDPLAHDVHRILGSLEKTLGSFQHFIQANEKPITTFSQKGLGELTHLAKDLRESNGHLKKILAQVDASPLNFIKKSPPRSVSVP